jgi:hypothetical protein
LLNHEKIDSLIKDLNRLQDERIKLSANHRRISPTPDLNEVRNFLKAHEKIADISKEMIQKNLEVISFLPDGDEKNYLSKRLIDNHLILKQSQNIVLIFRASEKKILSDKKKLANTIN